MENNSTRQLLEKYRNGTISDDELTLLNTLTHKDEVMSSARRGATGIIRRRIVGGVSMAVVLLMAGAGVYQLISHNSPSNAPMVTENREVAPAAEILPEETMTVEEPAAQEVAQVEKPIVVKHPQTRQHAAVPKTETQPVVYCNNQCEADSVINDIWKFLKA